MKQSGKFTGTRQVLAFLLKGLVRIVFGLLSLVLAVVLLLYLPPVQHILTRKLSKQLAGKTGTEISIGSLRFNLNGNLVLKNFFLEDQQQDTLLYADDIEMDLSVWHLMKKTIHIDFVGMKGIRSGITMDPVHNTSNYDFIVESFSDGENKKSEKEKNSGWKISMGYIHLRKISFTLSMINQMNLQVLLGEFKAECEKTDLNRLEFLFDQIRLADTSAEIIMYNQPDEPDSAVDGASSLLTIAFNTLSLENITTKLIRENNMDLNVYLGLFELKKGNVNQDTREISVKSFLLEHSSLNYTVLNAQDSQTVDKSEPDQQTDGFSGEIGWNIKLNEVTLTDNAISLHQQQVPDTSGFFDPNHLTIRDLDMIAEDIRLDNHGAHVLISNFGFEESERFRLKKFSGEFSAGSGLIELKNFELATDDSRLNVDLSVSDMILNSVSKSDCVLPVTLKISDSYAGREDLEYFIGDKPGLKGLNAISLDVESAGNLCDIYLDHADLVINEESKISLKGHLIKVMEPDARSVDLDIVEISASLNEIGDFIPDVESFRKWMPEEFSVQGRIRGSMADASLALNINSSKGDLSLSSVYKNRGKDLGDTLMLDLLVDNYDIRGILQSGTLENVSLNGSVGASGLATGDPAIDTDLVISIKTSDINIDSLHIRGYYDSEKAAARINSPGPLLDFNFDGQVFFRDTIIDFDASARFSSISVYELGFGENPFLMSMGMKASGRKSGKQLEGKLGIDSLEFSGSEPYAINMIRTDFLLSSDTNRIDLESDNINLLYASNIPFEDIPERLISMLKKSFNPIEHSGIDRNGKIKFDVRFRESFTRLGKYITGLDSVYVENITVDLEEGKGSLKAHVNIPYFRYRNIDLDSLVFDFDYDSLTINYLADLKGLAFSSFYFSDISLRGFGLDSVQHNQLLKKDSIGNTQYFIGVDLIKIPGGKLAIIPVSDSLILNGYPWQVQEGSRVILDRENQLKGEFSISREAEKFRTVMEDNKQFFLDVANFDLGNLSELFGYQREGKTLDGNINLNAEINFSDTIPDIDAVVSVTDFEFNRMKLGNIRLEAYNNQKKQVSIKVRLDNEANRIGLNGIYKLSGGELPLNADLTIDIGSLSAFESLGNGQVNELEGKLKGDIRMKGNLNDFELNGSLAFNGIGFFAEQLNNSYYIKNEVIYLKGKELGLNSFVLSDSLGNQFSLDGTIGYLEKETHPLNVHILADRFTFYNTPETMNPNLFGRLILSADARATGTLEDPKLDIGLIIENESDLTYVMPPKQINLVSYDEIVEFESPGEKEDTQVLAVERSQLTDTLMAGFGGFEVMANLSFRDGASFKLVIDPNSGDFVSVSGSGELNLQIQEGTDPLLSGVYELKKGVYQVSFYGLVQKSFDIVEGSTITWAGDPENGRVNITASHVLRTSSTGLIAAETAGLPDEEMNQYRRTLPYEVKIMIRGTFKRPELDFEINLIDENKAAYPLVVSKLNRLNGPGYESELTQQVFGLLTIGSFIPEQTFSSGGGGYGTALATTAAANSLNGILTNELNKLSGKYLTGINIDVGMQSYSQMNAGSANTQTTMDVRFSKNFFDDRVTIEAQTSFDVDGDTYPNYAGDKYSNFQSDFTIKYDITPGGEYKLKAFNRSAYDIIYKDIRSTGIAIIFIREFDRLSDIKKRQKKGNEITTD